MKSRKIKDILLNSLTYLYSSFGVLILILIVIFIFSNGARSISFDLLKGDYYSESYTLKYDKLNDKNFYYIPKKDEYSDVVINGASSLEYFTQIIDYIYQITNNFSNPEQ